MHFWRTVLLIPIFFIFFTGAEARSESLSNSEQERQLLQAEIPLAQKTHIYFILNLKEKKVYVKARGILLRDLDIKKVSFWGSHENVRTGTLTGKAAFSEPKREEIVPENAMKDKKPEIKAAPAESPSAPASIDIKALELEDMPSSYRLKFDEGLVISVKPDKGGIVSGLYSMTHSLTWYISQPILTVWYAITNGRYGALNLVLDEKDAKAFYWSIHEGNGVVIYNPQNR